MKKSLLFLFLIINSVLFSQAPEKINYQAIIRNSGGNLVTNAMVALRVQIRSTSPTGAIVYQERHTPTTSVQGLINVSIGSGNVESGNFSAINWSSGLYFIQLWVNFNPGILNGGTWYDFGTQQLLSVPYALFAKSAENQLAVKTTIEPVGINCTTGGIKLEYGYDSNFNDILDITEVNSLLTQYVCNGLPGANGAQGLQGIQGPAGAVGPQGPSGNGFQNGSVLGQILFWNGSTWNLLNPGTQSQILTICNGLPTWTTGGVCPGVITSLNCLGATHLGVLQSGVTANGASSSITYSGGNGGPHNGQVVTSTGIPGLTATLAAGNFANGSGTLVYTISGTPTSSGTASFALNIGGQICTLNRTVILPVGTVTALTCGSATNIGSLTALSAASGVSSIVPYTGANGGTHNGQTVTSTGVTGLTATLVAGTFAVGSGSLTYTITGTPSAGGTASFALNIGGQTCILTRTVNLPVGTISTLSCGTATNIGVLTAGLAASGVSSSVPYTGGNGGTHNGQTVSSTGVTGLTATLIPGTFVTGSGSLTYTITGTPSASGTASFALNIGGQTCVLIRTVNLPVGSISTLSCGTATNSGTLTAGIAASGVSSSVPYTGGNGGTHNGQTVTSTGVIGLTATLVAGTFAVGAGSLTYIITGTPSASGTASFALNIGGQTCILSRTVGLTVGTISTISCGTATNIGTLTAGAVASGVSSSVPYTGGNGGTHNGQTVTSTGVTGLTATLTAGTFAVGAGSLTYTITGTPSAGGTASFSLNIGGQTCTLTRSVNNAYPTGTVHCTGSPTAIVEVTNPTTGKQWMDRNLGASQVATSSTDANAYGDLYQWGRRADGHQCRTSPTTSTLSSTDQPAHGNFILTSNSPYDWRSPQNNNLWQGVSGINNPCPIGFRIPTNTELDAERLSWSSSNSTGAFASSLKLPVSGYRDDVTGSLISVGSYGHFSSSTVNGTNCWNLDTYSSSSLMSPNGIRAEGYAVRCIKN